MKEKMETRHSNSDKDNYCNSSNSNENKIADERMSHDGGEACFLLSSFFNTAHAR